MPSFTSSIVHEDRMIPEIEVVFGNSEPGLELKQNRAAEFLGDPRIAKASALWCEYDVDCKARSVIARKDDEI